MHRRIITVTVAVVLALTSAASAQTSSYETTTPPPTPTAPTPTTPTPTSTYGSGSNTTTVEEGSTVPAPPTATQSPPKAERLTSTPAGPTQPATPSTPVRHTPRLAFTGYDTELQLALGFLLMAAGFGLWRLRRRRPAAEGAHKSFGRDLEAIWRRRLTFAGTLVVCLGAVVAGTLALPRSYEATATLFVGQQVQAPGARPLDPRIGDQLTRTYTALAADPNLAAAVVPVLPYATTRDRLLDHMSFTPVQGTQLLKLTATDRSAARAQVTANAYARTFVERSREKFVQGDAPAQISLSEAASAPTKPAAPNRTLDIILGSLLALLIATAAVLWRDRRSDSLPEEASDAEVLGRPVLAHVPDLDSRGVHYLEGADALRLLRTNVDFRHPGTRVLAVTSSAPQEGKSTIAGHLAVTAAVDGDRVAIVEADLRRPGLRQTLPGALAPESSAGLTNYLMGMAGVDDILTQHPELPGLSVIWPGPLVSNPSALLRDARLAGLLEELKERFDRIIVDTSPITIGADASLVAARADGVLFVVDGRRTRRAEATRALRQLETVTARVVGVVVNRSGQGHPDRYSAYLEIPSPVEPDPIAALLRRER